LRPTVLAVHPDACTGIPGAQPGPARPLGDGDQSGLLGIIPVEWSSI